MKIDEPIKKATIIILGATGDLSKRKILPALYELVRRKKIIDCLLVGAALENIDSESVLERTREFIPRGDNATWRLLRESFTYVPINFTELADFQHLNNVVSKREKERGLSGNRLVYLAAPPSLFCAITENCAKSGLVTNQSELADTWQRIVYEKPFGSDLKSCQEINACIAKYFDEDQIWRMDHYLSKELVSNIELLRFSNTMFEPLWFSKYVDHMQIVLDEKVTVEDRGSYYDAYGAIKDVVQNHMIQLLALMTMDEPVSLSGEYLRDAKAAVTEKMVFEDGILGQYEGYKNETGVDPQSTTETFAMLKVRVDTPRWRHVPFFLRTGKSLERRSVAIHVFFRPVVCKLEEVSDCRPNILTIRIFPDSGFLLQLNVKKPSAEEVIPIDLSFCYSCKFELEEMHAYERLILDIMRGYKSVGVRNDEIEASWRAIDRLNEMNLPIYSYKIGSNGPEEGQEFIKKYGKQWFYGHKSARE